MSLFGQDVFDHGPIVQKEKNKDHILKKET